MIGLYVTIIKGEYWVEVSCRVLLCLAPEVLSERLFDVKSDVLDCSKLNSIQAGNQI